MVIPCLNTLTAVIQIIISINIFSTVLRTVFLSTDQSVTEMLLINPPDVSIVWYILFFILTMYDNINCSNYLFIFCFRFSSKQRSERYPNVQLTQICPKKGILCSTFSTLLSIPFSS